MWSEAGEQRQEDATDLDDRQHGNHDLRSHWHEHGHNVAFGDTECAQCVGDAIHFTAQFKVGHASALSFFSLPNDGRFRIGGRASVLFQAVVNDVHHAADAPFRPGNAAREVQHPRIGLPEADIQVL